MSTIHDSRYKKVIETLRFIRDEKGIKQGVLADKLGQHQSYVAKVEGLERRLDLLELLDWLDALDHDFYDFIERTGIVKEREIDDNSTDNIYSEIAVPIDAKSYDKGVIQILKWRNETKTIELQGVELEQYKLVESQISATFAALNNDDKLKNRDVIAKALRIAVDELPNLNPSDIYQHIVYRLYIREYRKSNPEQSWKRASGDALEIFIVEHYNPVLQPQGIIMKALNLEKGATVKALKEMGLHGLVGNSKLDIALYGLKNGVIHIFGGIHCKASLAERVSDDVDCSLKMMQKGFVSYLYTFDNKSFPPPTGDLINRGELGSGITPTDKRRYVEDMGQFDACFSYNTRGAESPVKTKSGKRIYVSTLKPNEDSLPATVIAAWKKFSLTI